jgi:hypothetical protein
MGATGAAGPGPGAADGAAAGDAAAGAAASRNLRPAAEADVKRRAAMIIRIEEGCADCIVF